LIKIELLVINGCIITMDSSRRILYNSGIAVSGDSILEIGSSDELIEKYTADNILDASGKYIFPGLVSTHTHLFQTILKGLGRDKPLLEWLDSSVRRALHLYDDDTIHYAALTGLLEAVKTGNTTITDFQYCHPVKNLDIPVIEAYEKIGARGVLSKSHTDVSGFPAEVACSYVENEDDYFNELETLMGKYQDHPLVKMSLAPGIIWDHSRDGYLRTREFADKYNLPITMHLAETEDDDRYSLDKWGMRAIPFLEECGILGPDFVAVHSVHLTESDIEAFIKHGVSVSHCPLSNMILASGSAPIPRLLSEGINVSLACDGAASNDSQNMLEVLKATALQHKLVTKDASVVSASEVLEMATIGGAKALMMQNQIGSLESGKKADFFIYNPLKCSSTPVHDPITAIIYSSTPENVETTVIGGKIVYDNGVFPGLDVEEILKETNRLAGSIVKRAGLGNVQWNQNIQPI